MGNELEKRVSKLEQLTRKLGQSSQITNEVVTELTTELSGIVREQLKEEMVTREKEIESNVISKIESTIESTVETTIKDKLDERGLSKVDADRLTNARLKRYRELLGNSKGDEYKLFIPFYQYMFKTAYCKKFGVLRFADIDPSQLKDALEFTNAFTVIDRSWCIEALHNNYRNQEFPNNKLVHAYERYFGISVS